MSNPVIGEIIWTPWNVVPRDWLPCEGQELPVTSNNKKLFDLIGNKYGGNGVNTFALPDMRGHVAVGMGTMQGKQYNIGEKGGSETVVLTESQIPQHSHHIVGTQAAAADIAPKNNVFSSTGGLSPYVSGGTLAPLAPSVAGPVGKNQPHENRQPFLPVRWLIAIDGLDPRRGFPETWVGQIRLMPYDLTPPGCIPCDGRLMQIAQNTALYSLLDTAYGGDGKTTFGVPDLRCRVPIGAGQGPGLDDYERGKPGGTLVHTLSEAEMPAHRHGIVAVDTDAADSKPTNQMMPAASEMYAPVPSSNNASQMNGSFLGSRGGGQPHPNQMPYVVMTYIMAAQGIFPPRA